MFILNIISKRNSHFLKNNKIINFHSFECGKNQFISISGENQSEKINSYSNALFSSFFNMKNKSVNTLSPSKKVTVTNKVTEKNDPKDIAEASVIFQDNYKYLVIDTETTGLSPWKDQIHQISGCIIINRRITEFFNFHINIDYENGRYIRSDGYEPKTAFQEFVNILDKYLNMNDPMDKYFLLGYNVSFDKNFLDRFFQQYSKTYLLKYIWGPNNLDVMTLASFNLRKERRNLSDFKQGTVAKYLGVNVSDRNLHNSLYDILICIEIFCIITGEIFEKMEIIYRLKCLIQDGKDIAIWEINQLLK